MDYIPLNNHMHVKNHMALWFLWFLWFLRVECLSNPLYKPLCEFLVFVDLLWFLCGSFCGFWSRVVFGSGLRVRSCLCGSVVLPSMLDADGCASSCSFWTAKNICPSPHFVLCFLSSPLEATFTNGENDHG